MNAQEATTLAFKEAQRAYVKLDNLIGRDPLPIQVFTHLKLNFPPCYFSKPQLVTVAVACCRELDEPQLSERLRDVLASYGSWAMYHRDVQAYRYAVSVRHLRKPVKPHYRGYAWLLCHQALTK